MTERVDLEFAGSESEAKRLEDRWTSWLWPAFPRLDETEQRRWTAKGGWSPPSTVLLTRFVDLGTMEYTFGIGDPPEPRFLPDFSLGLVQRWEVPGTRCLAVEAGALTVADGPDAAGDRPERRELGWIEQAWFVLMDPLEVRRVPDTGQEVLCVDRSDPLRARTELVSRIGFVESLPIHPNPALRSRVEWDFVSLHRVLDCAAWRHRYCTGDAPDEGVYLGCATTRSGAGDVSLSLRSDGRLSTPLAPAPPLPRSVTELARWSAAPLKWARELDEPPLRLAAERVRQAKALRQRRAERVPARRIGHLAAQPDDDHVTVALYSATHPATGDQLVTRSRAEATDLGYRLDGLLGYAYRPYASPTLPADYVAAAGAGPADIPWGSRLGRTRRRPGASDAEAKGE